MPRSRFRRHRFILPLLVMIQQRLSLTFTTYTIHFNGFLFWVNFFISVMINMLLITRMRFFFSFIHNCCWIFKAEITRAFSSSIHDNFNRFLFSVAFLNTDSCWRHIFLIPFNTHLLTVVLNQWIFLTFTSQIRDNFNELPFRVDFGSVFYGQTTISRSAVWVRSFMSGFGAC